MSGKKVTISFSKKTLDILEKLAEEKGMKKSAVVALALAEYARAERGKQ